MKESIATYPNQKIIHINKNPFVGDYLSIDNDEWIEASKILSPNTFKVYLYLASNANGFDLILSRQAIMNRLDMSTDSYKRAIKELSTKKFVVEKQGNVYDFFTTPMGAKLQPANEAMVAKMPPSMGQNCNQYGSKNATSMGAKMQPEISKISNTNNLSKNANAKGLRTLEDLTKEELESIKTDYKNKVKYKVTQERLGLSCDITKNTWKEVDGILEQRACKKRHEETVNRLGIALDADVTLDMAYRFATEIMNFSITKEEMQNDMDIHAKYGQPYTWKNLVNPPSPINRSNFYDYTASLCSMLQKQM